MMLATMAEQRGSELGARYLVLDTSERAADLIALYESRGLHVQWECLNYRSVVMAKELAPT